MTLLYRTAEWHGLAKLRMHTDSSLQLLQSLTEEFGLLMRNFHELTSSDFITLELPKEKNARNRKKEKKANSSLADTSRVPKDSQPTGSTDSRAKDKSSQTEKPSGPPIGEDSQPTGSTDSRAKDKSPQTEKPSGPPIGENPGSKL